MCIMYTKFSTDLVLYECSLEKLMCSINNMWFHLRYIMANIISPQNNQSTINESLGDSCVDIGE